MRKKILVLGVVFGLFYSCSQNDADAHRNENRGAALGTSYNVISITANEIDFQKDIDSVFIAINHSLSTYIPESDISRINHGDSTVVVDRMFEDVFELSKMIYEDTDGYFDPTVGTLVNAWGFGPEQQIILDSLKVDSLLNYVGLDKVSINSEKQLVKRNKNIYLDFNAIAKGYAIDRIAAMLNAKGVKNYLIEVGGELVAKGRNIINDKSWVVGIDDPQMQTDRTTKILIHLNDRALASSGNYRKFRIDESTGKKYVHTVNPKTGFTQISNTLAVTILADDCATADAYATAFMAMDLDEAFKLINENKDLEAYIIYLDKNGDTQEYLTKGFKDLVVN
ncbi:thiamine biosynthesis lipoprotein [Maribacter orientalis]|uniref:FAD:protein FMN transferase n=1 Tax=Maribacter orientalis TaxID=228957 RepID=A0A1H7VHG1_9FLAO|nr:FAD:protein FMN transferase [Maribacter orientalis]SEM08711.1 thiamine biosynthesis lipoprotein [Maribacter orientalis]|tara:strand:- start:710 stop:1723 length:1014 start_codon:yes stop_codon:yes gene_type:complete